MASKFNNVRTNQIRTAITSTRTKTATATATKTATATAKTTTTAPVINRTLLTKTLQIKALGKPDTSMSTPAMLSKSTEVVQRNSTGTEQNTLPKVSGTVVKQPPKMTAITKATIAKKKKKEQYYSTTAARNYCYGGTCSLRTIDCHAPNSNAFSYDLSKVEQGCFLRKFKSAMKSASEAELQLLRNGWREAYLTQRYERAPEDKFNYPEATSMRYGWFHRDSALYNDSINSRKAPRNDIEEKMCRGEIENLNNVKDEVCSSHTDFRYSADNDNKFWGGCTLHRGRGGIYGKEINSKVSPNIFKT